MITLCDKVKEICPDFSGAPLTAHWSMADPAAEAATDEDTYPDFVRAADEIDTRVALLIAELSHPDRWREERSCHPMRPSTFATWSTMWPKP